MGKKMTSLMIGTALAFTLYQPKTNAEPIAAPKVNLQEQNTMSVLWFQTSGEAKALYCQGYNLAKWRLDELLKNKPKDSQKKPAVVLDIDETIVDNSPFYAAQIASGKGLSWKEWVERAEAKPLPGAVEFLTYAHKKGVEIFYISNRKEVVKKATIRNLKRIGAPLADAKHVLLQQPDEMGKEQRRQEVARKYDILLLFGDNLGDFSGFDRLSATGRVQAAARDRDEFGKKLIIFPNPMYGDWEEAIYHYNTHMPDDEKNKLRKASLQPMQP
ncbi:5'-nucleotidase, lipoprotein e(P4) family [Neobacillus sp. SM06]|uniref:5'-nucleotidase, lipoprotein e(P4) family n=1 Tax=Neobacillus sp. SM06 TaxID=3422492 RepID=UPI003D27D9FE